MDEQQKQLDAIWSERYAAPRQKPRTSWAASPRCIAHITERICGRPCASLLDAHILRLRNSGRAPFGRAISIGSGTCHSELGLLQAGIVRNFECWELSGKAVELSIADAARRGLETRFAAHHGDAFSEAEPGGYDLVFWDNALHHMPDADAALELSRKLLRRGGCLYMFDYVGPSRFQWSAQEQEIVRNVLAGLDDVYFLIPGTEEMWKKEPNMLSEAEMIAADPSEAADSGRILPAVARHFPQAEITPLGGLLYVLALDGILINIPENSPILNSILKLDALLSAQGYNYFAVASCTVP